MTSDFQSIRSSLSRDSFTRQGLFESRLDETIGLGDVFAESVVNLGFKAPGSALSTLDEVRIARETGRVEELNFIQRPFLGIGEDATKRKGDLLSEEEVVQIRQDDPQLAERLSAGKDTSVSLEIKRRRLEEERRSQLILSQQGGIAGGATKFSGAILGSMFEPVNLVAGLGVGGVVRGVAFGAARATASSTRVAKAFERLRDSTIASRGAAFSARVPGGSRTLALAGMDAAATVPPVVLGVSGAKFSDSQYGAEDAAVDFLASMAIGRVFDTFIPLGLERLARGRVSAARRTEVVETARRLFNRGQQMDLVQPMTANILAENLPGYGTVKTDRIKPKVSQREDGAYEASFAGEGGLVGSTKGRGDTLEAAVSDLYLKINDPDALARETGVNTASLVTIQREAEARRPVQSIDDLTEAEFSNFRTEFARLGGEMKKLEEVLRLRQKNRLRARTAEQAARRAPKDPSAQKELVNAKQAERRANRKMDEFLEGDAARSAFQSTRIDNKARANAADRLRQGAIRSQKAESAEGLNTLTTVASLDPDSPSARIYDMDPFIQDFNPGRIAARAASAPKADVQFRPDAASPDRPGLERKLEDPLVNESDKAFLRQGLKEVDEDRGRLGLIEGLISCLSGGRNRG